VNPLGYSAAVLLCDVRRSDVMIAWAGDVQAVLGVGDEMRRLTFPHRDESRVLASWIGRGNGDAVISSRAVEMRRGERLLLMTDGITDVLEEDAITRALDVPSIQHAANLLVNGSARLSGDDATAVVVEEAPAGAGGW